MAGKPGRPRKGEGKAEKQVYLRLPEELKERAERAATESSRNLNQWIVWAIRQELKVAELNYRPGDEG